MPTIQFRAKAVDGRVKVPEIKRHHCDMSAFRNDREFGGYANSDLFPAILKRALAKHCIPGAIEIESPPAGVTVDASGFLALVTINVESWK